MKRSTISILLLLAGFSSWSCRAEETARQFLLSGCGFGKIAIVDDQCREKWNWPIPDEVSDSVMLENGNILHSSKAGFIREIQPDFASGKGGKIIWEWSPPLLNGKKGEIHTCQPLPGGKILVGESHDGISFIREIDRKTGDIVKSVELKNLGGKHSTFRQIRKTPTGTYLITRQIQNGKVMEVDATGKVIRTFPEGGFTAVRLPNGNTLIAGGSAHRIIEVNPANDIVWEIAKNDLPDVTIGLATGLQRLPNGNTVITNWGGHGGAKGPAVLEVTPDKKIIWKSTPSIAARISSVQVLDKNILTQQPVR